MKRGVDNALRATAQGPLPTTRFQGNKQKLFLLNGLGKAKSKKLMPGRNRKARGAATLRALIRKNLAGDSESSEFIVAGAPALSKRGELQHREAGSK